MKYEILTESVHPITGEIYKVGDNVVIYQGRFGHNNIITINSMFKTDENDYIFVSDEKYKEKDYKKRWPSNPKGTFLNEVKRKISQKEIDNINNARNLVRQYGN